MEAGKEVLHMEGHATEDCLTSYEEFARLAETRLAQNTLNYLKLA